MTDTDSNPKVEENADDGSQEENEKRSLSGGSRSNVLLGESQNVSKSVPVPAELEPLEHNGIVNMEVQGQTPPPPPPPEVTVMVKQTPSQHNVIQIEGDEVVPSSGSEPLEVNPSSPAPPSTSPKTSDPKIASVVNVTSSKSTTVSEQGQGHVQVPGPSSGGSGSGSEASPPPQPTVSSISPTKNLIRMITLSTLMVGNKNKVWPAPLDQVRVEQQQLQQGQGQVGQVQGQGGPSSSSSQGQGQAQNKNGNKTPIPIIIAPSHPSSVGSSADLALIDPRGVESIIYTCPGSPGPERVASSAGQVVRATGSVDSYDNVCRICHDNPSKTSLITPCLCKGSMGMVHRACLERWLAESAKDSCEICGYNYVTVRRPRYTGCTSVWKWMKKPSSPTDTRNILFDLACFFVLTPLAAISAWLCVLGARNYSFSQDSDFHQKRGSSSSHYRPETTTSNSTWTSIGLLTLTGTLLAAYYVWLFVAIRYHIQVWRDWQARNFIVSIVSVTPVHSTQNFGAGCPHFNNNGNGGGINGNVSSTSSFTSQRSSHNSSNGGGSTTMTKGHRKSISEIPPPTSQFDGPSSTGGGGTGTTDPDGNIVSGQDQDQSSSTTTTPTTKTSSAETQTDDSSSGVPISSFFTGSSSGSDLTIVFQGPKKGHGHTKKNGGSGGKDGNCKIDMSGTTINNTGSNSSVEGGGGSSSGPQGQGQEAQPLNPNKKKVKKRSFFFPHAFSQ